MDESKIFCLKDTYMRCAKDIATALYYTGIDPFTKQEVYVAKGLRDLKMQRALMQFLSRKTGLPCGRPWSRPGGRT
jgi:hypothetical protein